MKNYIVIFFLFLSLFSVSQKKSKDMGKITKTTLSAVSTLGDLIPDLPNEFKSVAIECVAKVDGKVIIATCESLDLNDALRDVLKNADTGSKFFIDVNFNSQLNGTRSYAFHTVE